MFTNWTHRYATVKRGAMFVVLIAISINPWRFLTQAAVFLSVLNVFAVFSSCTSIILIADYWIVRQRKWKIPDLYHEDGIYWFTKGWNFRAVAAWWIGVIPSIRKLIIEYLICSALLGNFN